MGQTGSTTTQSSNSSGTFKTLVDFFAVRIVKKTLQSAIGPLLQRPLALEQIENDNGKLIVRDLDFDYVKLNEAISSLKLPFEFRLLHINLAQVNVGPNLKVIVDGIETILIPNQSEDLKHSSKRDVKPSDLVASFHEKITDLIENSVPSDRRNEEHVKTKTTLVSLLERLLFHAEIELRSIVIRAEVCQEAHLAERMGLALFLESLWVKNIEGAKIASSESMMASQLPSYLNKQIYFNGFKIGLYTRPKLETELDKDTMLNQENRETVAIIFSINDGDLTRKNRTFNVITLSMDLYRSKNFFGIKKMLAEINMESINILLSPEQLQEIHQLTETFGMEQDQFHSAYEDWPNASMMMSQISNSVYHSTIGPPSASIRNNNQIRISTSIYNNKSFIPDEGAVSDDMFLSISSELSATKISEDEWFTPNAQNALSTDQQIEWVVDVKVTRVNMSLLYSRPQRNILAKNVDKKIYEDLISDQINLWAREISFSQNYKGSMELIIPSLEFIESLDGNNFQPRHIIKYFTDEELDRHEDILPLPADVPAIKVTSGISDEISDMQLFIKPIDIPLDILIMARLRKWLDCVNDFTTMLANLNKKDTSKKGNQQPQQQKQPASRMRVNCQLIRVQLLVPQDINSINFQDFASMKLREDCMMIDLTDVSYSSQHEEQLNFVQFQNIKIYVVTEHTKQRILQAVCDQYGNNCIAFNSFREFAVTRQLNPTPENESDWSEFILNNMNQSRTTLTIQLAPVTANLMKKDYDTLMNTIELFVLAMNKVPPSSNSVASNSNSAVAKSNNASKISDMSIRVKTSKVEGCIGLDEERKYNLTADHLEIFTVVGHAGTTNRFVTVTVEQLEATTTVHERMVTSYPFPGEHGKALRLIMTSRPLQNILKTSMVITGTNLLLDYKLSDEWISHFRQIFARPSFFELVGEIEDLMQLNIRNSTVKLNSSLLNMETLPTAAIIVKNITMNYPSKFPAPNNQPTVLFFKFEPLTILISEKSSNSSVNNKLEYDKLLNFWLNRQFVPVVHFRPFGMRISTREKTKPGLHMEFLQPKITFNFCPDSLQVFSEFFSAFFASNPEGQNNEPAEIPVEELENPNEARLDDQIIFENIAANESAAKNRPESISRWLTNDNFITFQENYFPRAHPSPKRFFNIPVPHDYPDPSTFISIQQLDLIVNLFNGSDWPDKHKHPRRKLPRSSKPMVEAFFDKFNFEMILFSFEDVKDLMETSLKNGRLELPNWMLRVDVDDIQLIDAVPKSNNHMLLCCDDSKEAKTSHIFSTLLKSYSVLVDNQQKTAYHWTVNLLPLRINLALPTARFLQRFFKYAFSSDAKPNNSNNNNNSSSVKDQKPSEDTFIEYVRISPMSFLVDIKLRVLSTERTYVKFSEIVIHDVNGWGNLFTFLGYEIWSQLPHQAPKMLGSFPGLTELRSAVNAVKGASPGKLGATAATFAARALAGAWRVVDIALSPIDTTNNNSNTTPAVPKNGSEIRELDEEEESHSEQELKEDQYDYKKDDEFNAVLHNKDRRNMRRKVISSAYANQPGTFGEGLSQALDALAQELEGVRQQIYDAAEEYKKQSLTGVIYESVKVIPYIILKPTRGLLKAGFTIALAVRNMADSKHKIDSDRKYGIADPSKK